MDELVSSCPVQIQRIEVRRLSLPMHQRFASRHNEIHQRDIVMVRVDSDLGAGWGECVALPEPTYTDEFAAGAFAVLSDELAPRLVRRHISVTDLVAKLAAFPGNPLAKASLEMAILDIVLKSQSRSLPDWLGANRTQIDAGITIGLADPETTHKRVGTVVNQGYGRVKLKIQSADGLTQLDSLVRSFPKTKFVVDANQGCTIADLDALTEAAEKLEAIEQPFPATDVEAARQLVASTSTPIIADEPIVDVSSMENLVQQKACSAVAIKPPRLGGLVATKTAIRAAAQLGLPLTAGGFFESGLGRHSLAAVAALDQFSLTGDLCPVSTWISVDPWPDIKLVDANGVARIELPTEPGVAPSPDLGVLQSVTASTTLIS